MCYNLYMKINGITSHSLVLRANQNKSSIQSSKTNTKRGFDYSALELSGSYNKINFEQNYGKNISRASLGINKAIDSNDHKKAIKILRSFYQQNQGKGKFFDNIEENMQTTAIYSGGKRYLYKYPTGEDSDLLINKHFLAYRKGDNVIEINLSNDSEKTYKENNFLAYDLIKAVKKEFFDGENDTCAELMEEFYKNNKNSKLQNETTVSDDGILIMSKEKNGKGKMQILFMSPEEIHDGDLEGKQGISIDMNKKDNMVSYSTQNSYPDGFKCKRTFVFNYN